MIANNTKCVKDRAYVRVLGTNCSIIIVSGLSGDDGRSLTEMRGVANGTIGFCRRSMEGGSTLHGVFGRGGVRTIVRFTNLGTINRSIHRPLVCCSGGLVDAVTLLRIVARTGIGGFIFSSSTAICNITAIVPLIRNVPLNTVGPCNEAGCFVRRVLHSLCITSGS